MSTATRQVNAGRDRRCWQSRAVENWLLAGQMPGGERAAAIYSPIETRQAQRLDPEAYLRTVLDRIADYPVNRVAELLPCNSQVEPICAAA